MPFALASSWSQGRWHALAPLDEAAEGDEICTEEAEDVEALSVAKGPRPPSAADVDLHERMHVPCGGWCKWCSIGHGRGVPHTHSQGSTVPIVGIDCFFETGDCLKTRAGLSSEMAPRGWDGPPRCTGQRRSEQVPDHPML